jgi:hypothetical protein
MVSWKNKKQTMTDNPNDIPNDIFDDPPQEWRLKRHDESAARRALYAARMQLNGE